MDDDTSSKWISLGFRISICGVIGTHLLLLLQCHPCLHSLADWKGPHLHRNNYRFRCMRPKTFFVRSLFLQRAVERLASVVKVIQGPTEMRVFWWRDDELAGDPTGRGMKGGKAN